MAKNNEFLSSCVSFYASLFGSVAKISDTGKEAKSLRPES